MDSLDVAEARKHFSELLARVAHRGEVILITRRGRPVAKLVPPDSREEAASLAAAEGWLEDDDPFFALVDEAVAARRRRLPRILLRDGAEPGEPGA